MKTYVVLLRGINVGGKNVLPMKELVGLLEDTGCRNVRTYIQSGNVVLQADSTSASLAERITATIERSRGFAPRVIVLGFEDLKRAIANNPFPEAESDPKALHFGFLDSVPSHPDLEKLEAIRADTERFRLIDKVFYLHAPDGVGRSKLAAGCEKLLGVAMTDRNWRTVDTLRDMAGR